MDIVRFDEMKKTWHQIAKNHDGDVPSSYELNVYRKMLNIFQPGDFYFYIANIASVQMEYVSDTVNKVLGINPDDFSIEYIFENMHPLDRERFAVHEKKVTEFFVNLLPEKVLKYKVSYDFRLRCADGRYKWILMQTVTIQSNDEGSVIRVLGVQTDITHLKTDDKPSGLSFLGLDGEPSFYNVPVDSPIFVASNDLFTDREKEILKYIISGKNTLGIAEILNISIHTVNTHRKNIISKSGCSTPAELGAKSVKEGWI